MKKHLKLSKAGKLPSAFSSTQKSGPLGLFSSYKHVPDEYDNKKDMRLIEKAKFRSKIRGGPFGVSTNIHRPLQSDSSVYDYQRYLPKDGDDKKNSKSFKGRNHQSLQGTRFGKSSTSKQAWRPSNPAKKGYNCTLNKNRYYHTGLYFKEKVVDKTHQEKIWIPNSRGTFAKPCPESNKFVRNRNRRLKSMRRPFSIARSTPYAPRLN